MVEFNLWGESLIFCLVFSVIIIVPCVLITLLGRKMILRLGQYPSKTPVILLSIFWPYVILASVTFLALLGFYNAVGGK